MKQLFSVLAVILCSTILSDVRAQDSKPAASATISATPASKYPYGTPVKDKPGFVYSPYAPDAGFIDLRGFPKDTEVRDPYSGKVFLVPEDYKVDESGASPTPKPKT